MSRPPDHAAESIVQDPAAASLSADELSRQTGIGARAIRRARERLGIEPPTRAGDLAASITIRLTPAELRDLDRYVEPEETRTEMVREAIRREVHRRAVEESVREDRARDDE